MEFKSNCKLDKANYKEFFEASVLNLKKIIIVSLFFIVASIYNIIIGNFYYAIYFCVMELIVLFFFFIRLKSSSYNYNRMLMGNNGLEYVRDITINSKGITIKKKEIKDETTYSFENIIGITESKNLILLNLKYNVAVIIDKNNLKGGTKEELFKYLFEVYPNIKKKKIKNAKTNKIVSLICFIITIITLIVSIVMLNNNSNYSNKLMKHLEDKGYRVNLMEKYTNNYEISKNNHTYYFYTFKNKDIAERNFDRWKREVINPLSSNCTSSINYKKCAIYDRNYRTILIRNDRYVLYSSLLLPYEDVQNQFMNDINNLK